VAYHFVAPPAALLRIGRWPNPFRWPPAPASFSAREPNDLSRWDDPDGAFSTLYAATDLLGAFIETLPYYRSDEAFLARLHTSTGSSGARRYVPTCASSTPTTRAPTPS
jgi:hypothetical protein